MSNKRSAKLSRALRHKILVQFSTAFEQGRVNGYVLDIGPRFFLVASVTGEIWFNGFQCFRLTNVRNLRVPDRFSAFTEAALKKRHERLPKKPLVKMDSLQDLLLSANRAFPLVTIHREQIDPDVCHIGLVKDINKGLLSLLEIDPHARWEKWPTKYRLTEITRVDFGGDYEDALNLIGGDPNV